MRSKFKKAKLKNFQKIFFQSNQKKSFSKESSQKLTPMIDKQATKHFCELTPFKWWKLNKNKMCSKSLLTIKSSNESPKYQKTSFKKNGNRQISRNEGANGHKNDFVKQTQMSRKQDGHKDWRQSSHSAETEQSRFLNRNLVCQKSMTLAINEKQD